MNNKGYGNIPSALFEYITFLARALPLRSVPTFIELLVGAMLTETGFVTDAWLAINPLRTLTAYYKWLQEGKWSWVALGVQLARLVVKYFPQALWQGLKSNRVAFMQHSEIRVFGASISPHTAALHPGHLLRRLAPLPQADFT